MTPDALAVQHLMVALMSLSIMVLCADRALLSTNVDERNRWMLSAVTGAVVFTVFMLAVGAFMAGAIASGVAG